MMGNGAMLLAAVFAFCGGMGVFATWKLGGYRMVGWVLLMGLSAGLLWAFLAGCAYEPNRWVKVMEITMCVLSLGFGIYGFLRDERMNRR